MSQCNLARQAADPRDPAPRVIRPRNRTYTRLPVVAFMGDDTLGEDGQIGTVSDLIANLPTMSPTLFATMNAADFLGQVDPLFTHWHPTSWQWRTSQHERDIVRPDGVRVASRVTVTVHFFGWKGKNYHKIIDPISMYGHKLDRVYPGREAPLVRLLRWAVTLRDFCDENQLDVRPTTGAISAQFLTDRRFYPNPRRKVPTATNEAVRARMPGNHYRLAASLKPDNQYTAHYIDQHRAHHFHAAHTPLPNADTIYAYGRFRDLAEPVLDSTIDNFYGLYCVDLAYQRKGSRAFGWLGRDFSPTLEKQFVWSNELTHLRDMGFTVTGVRAAWGSIHLDTGLPKYAQWAMQQLTEHDNAAWLKPLLLSAYGVLATKPRYAEAVFKLAKSGEPVTIHTGHHKLTGLHTQASVKLEPGICNVLHRGMIEAATRSESVGLAQYLSHLGHQVLSIYADAVIVKTDDDRPLPELPEPWRYKRQLNHLQFINQQAFMSGEMTKLPGVSAELRQLYQHAPGHAPRKKRFNLMTERLETTTKRI